MSAVAKHPCAHCGKRQPIDKLVYSRPTKRRYCIDQAACDRRAARQSRAQVSV